jgi:hypothetical protein
MTSSTLNPQILGQLPATLRDELIQAYGEIVRNFRERRWEPSELNAGKLCEITYSVLRGLIDGSYPARSYKPSNMVDACRALEQADSARFPRSVRIQIPRMLMALYEIRNNRGVGHVGGDVNPNEMDATCTLHMSQWLMAELVRIFHDTTTENAARAVAALVERTLPSIWHVDGLFRVLDTKRSMRDQTLLHLYRSTEPLTEQDLVAWTEHSNASVYRRDILRPLHRDRFIEYNEKERRVTLSPKGIAEAERILVEVT